MRILLLTGRLAEPLVRLALKECSSPHQVKVHVMPLDIAALATPQKVLSYLRRYVKAEDFDLIMVSGAIHGSMKIVEEEVGVKVVKGPKHAADIPYVITRYDLEKLSSEEPADEVLNRETHRDVSRILCRIEKEAIFKPHVCIGGKIVPVNPPPIRVISEISDAHLLNEQDLLSEVERRVMDGADIISLGFEAWSANPAEVKKTIKLIKREFEVPVVLDSLIPEEIIVGVNAGVDMIMSLEAGNIKKVSRILKDIPAVVIPYNSRKRFFARTSEEKLDLLEKNIRMALEYGVESVIADPVLNPINFTENKGLFQSLHAYDLFKRKMPEIPMLMGLCNVAELIDADSIGINALLTMIAAELGAGLILVAEKSDKAYRSTFEAAVASRMVSIAHFKSGPPKDLGIDLLIFKEKRRINVPISIKGVEVVTAKDTEKEYPLDRMGAFNLWIDHKDKLICVLYRGAKGKILIKGKTSMAICNEILRRGLISSLSHALYLGRELSKAEEALRIGKSYIQDEELFKEEKLTKILL